MTPGKLPRCNRSSNEKISYTKCASNIIDFIDANGPYDFVGLQEATNWQTLHSISSTLSKMFYVSYQSGKEQIVTFYSTDHKLDDSDAIITGSVTRPILITFFNNNLCVINLHGDHQHSVLDFDNHLIEILEKKYKKKISVILSKLQSYDIIMMGDFNEELRDRDSFNILSNKYFGITGGRDLWGINRNTTCCYESFDGRPNKYQVAFDHILANTKKMSSETIFVSNASDHSPVISKIDTSMNIGYDFDGVFHTSVSVANAMGERYPLDITSYIPFDKIINKIFNEIKIGHEIYIITARPNTDENKLSIEKLIDSTILSVYKNHIMVYFSNNSDKSNLVQKLRINKFYDDSCLRITEIFNNMINGNLPDLYELYFVNPDDTTLVKITNDNIGYFCDSSQYASQYISDSSQYASQYASDNIIDNLYHQL